MAEQINQENCTSTHLVIATHNKDKIAEIERLLRNCNYKLHAISDFEGTSEVEEDGATILNNAVKKARVAAEQTGLMALADDTGLEVDALDGAPGVFSSRFAGENVTYDDNNRKLLQSLQGVHKENRTAKFRCVIAIVRNAKVWTVEGVCEGLILESPRGTNGFGYDPVFYVPEEGKTFAEMEIEYKNRISHRGKALETAKVLLNELATLTD